MTTLRAVAAVAARGTALGHELLAAERDGAVAAVTGSNADARLIDELHGNQVAPPALKAGARSVAGAPTRA